MLRVVCAVWLLVATGMACAQVTLTKGTNFSVAVAADGRLAIDLLGRIWTVPAGGGAARPITDEALAARRPQWSPDSRTIVYQARTGNRGQLWLYRLDDETTTVVSDGRFFDLHPSWHPDGERIVYASDRRDSGLDLWELDIATGLTWRLSSLAGDETEPAWSADGQDLVYVHRHDDQWSLMLRRRGQPEQALVTSQSRLQAPSWRPDGSLITFQHYGEEGLSIDMVILSDPLLVRPLITGEDFFPAPVAWTDRHQLLYPANGQIRTRLFNSWTSSSIPFRATVSQKKSRQRAAVRQRRLPMVNEPGGRLVVRAARLFDGVGGGYRENVDIVIDGGRISAVEQTADRAGAIVVDMGDLTALSGFIDGRVKLPAEVQPSLGPALLTFGITTIVTDHPRADELNEVWSGKAMPGPRVLGRDWTLDLDAVSTQLPGTESLPVSPRGVRYEDAQVAPDAAAATLLSGLADARTRDMPALLSSRQARLVRTFPTAIRRFVETPELGARSTSIVLGSEPNGFPPGTALHAELRALSEAGLAPEFVLRTAGINAAAALGLGLQTGRIAPGSSADIVLVDGDPLGDINDTLNVVGVVRNGRFFSTIGLIERVEKEASVE